MLGAAETLAEQNVRHGIERIFGNTVEVAQVSPNAVRGMTADTVDRAAQRQNVRRLPAAVHEILTLIGESKGPWLFGESFTLAEEDARDTKEEAVDCYTHEVRNGLQDAAGMLVLTCTDGNHYELVDGADLDQDDPPVWIMGEAGYLERLYPSVTDWFGYAGSKVRTLSGNAASRIRQGRDAPSWSRYFVHPAGKRRWSST